VDRRLDHVRGAGARDRSARLAGLAAANRRAGLPDGGSLSQDDDPSRPPGRVGYGSVIIVDEPRDWPPLGAAAAAGAMLFVLWLLVRASTGDRFVPIVDHANLAFHEAGHLIVGLVSERLAVYGGTLGQLFFPLATAWHFGRRRDTLGFALTAGWACESTLNIATYMGDARARWDGDTLVVQTSNFRDDVGFGISGGGAPPSPAVKLTERFTRVSRDTIRYEATVDDPETWTAPWTVAFPLSLQPDYVMAEYACHEGNLGLKFALSGARADERKGMGK
jgi:hypothetical protein